MEFFLVFGLFYSKVSLYKNLKRKSFIDELFYYSLILIMYFMVIVFI